MPLSKSQRKKNKKKAKHTQQQQQQSKSTSAGSAVSVLNVDATEFVPSTYVTGEGASNSVPSLSADLNISGSETSSSYVSTQEQENVTLSPVDQTQNYNTRSHETKYDVVSEQSHAPVPGPPVSQNMQNFNLTDLQANVSINFAFNVQDYPPPVYQTLEQIQGFYDTVGRNYDRADALYSLQAVPLPIPLPIPMAIPVPMPHPDQLYFDEYKQRLQAVCDTTYLPGDDWEIPPYSQHDFNNTTTSSTASCLPDHNQLLFNTDLLLPENPEEPVIATPEDITSEDQTIDSTLANERNITTIEEAYESSSLANAKSDTWENPPKPRPGFVILSTGSTASCLPKHNKMFINSELLPENLKESVIATPEDIISKGQAINSTKANEHDTCENLSKSQSGFNNLLPASSSSASFLPNHNQLLFGTETLPDNPKESVISTTEDIISESQTMDSMLTNEHSITTNEDTHEALSLAFADKNTRENQPNPQLDFNNITTDSTASCLPEHSQEIAKIDLLPENPKDLVIATPEDSEFKAIIKEDQTIDSVLTNEHNIVTNKDAGKALSFALADKDSWENQPNSLLDFNNITTGSAASCLPELNQVIGKIDLLPENPKDLVIATPEDSEVKASIKEDQTIDSVLTNEHNIVTNEDACEALSLALDDKDSRENQPNPQLDFNNIATASTASCLPEHNQVIGKIDLLPENPKDLVIATPEDSEVEAIIKEDQTVDSVLTNEHKIVKNEDACEALFLALAVKDSRKKHPNSRLDINNIATGSTASCLPEHNQVIGKIDLLPENLKDLVIATPKGSEVKAITKEDQAIGSVPVNEDNNNKMKTYHNEKVVEQAKKSSEKKQNKDEAPKIFPVGPKNTKKKNKSHNDEVIYSNKEHVNVVFVGHVDAGKSTIGGQLMWLTGMVDKRTMEKYKKEAKEKSRESWYISWALDTNQEERDRGKTVETGRGYFETETKHFTILDAPGHKSFIPSMICGAAQADVAVLVLSARQNEFESGFDKGGQTRDHAMLVKLAGVKILIALINKMDDPTVKWAEARYTYCREKIIPYLKKLGFASKDVYFMPVSGQTGDGLMTAVPTSVCPWFKGPSFIQCLDNLPPIERQFEGPFVMPIVEKFKDKGTVVIGKIEAGSTHVTNNLLLMPNRVTVIVDKIWSDDKEVTMARAGENVKMKLKGIEEEEISSGFVLCDISKPISVARIFDAQMHVLNCGSIISKGFTAMMHTQCVVEEVEVLGLICLVDQETNEKTMKGVLRFCKNSDEVILRMQCSGLICLTTFKELAKLGCFTLRENNKVIAFGIVVKIIQ